jgi:hypothetical protein
MITRRSFFKYAAALVATLALAPEIAFGRKLELPSAIGSQWSAVQQTQFVRWFFFGEPKPEWNVYDRAMLESLPPHDQLEDQLTQMLLVAKQNYANGLVKWP